MKQLVLYSFIILTQLSNAQYLNGNNFDFDVAFDNIIEVYYKEFSICEIDLENNIIANDYYWFENGIIYEIDTDYEQIIGNYSKNEITVYDENYKLEKPVFSKMKLKKNNDPNFEIKISCEGNRIIIEDKNNKVADVLKLWIILKGTERLIQREKNKQIFLNTIQAGTN